MMKATKDVKENLAVALKQKAQKHECAPDVFTSFNSELNTIETECEIIYHNTIKRWKEHLQLITHNS